MKISVKHQKAIASLVPKAEQQAFVDAALSRAIDEKQASQADMVDVYIDGGSRGNPGPAGGGYAIYRGGKLVKKGSEFFGEQTNNRAEYLALRLALSEVKAHFPDVGVHCFMDSELVVKQMNGQYKVKSDSVKAIHQDVRRIADQFSNFIIEHIPRNQNKVADQLANEAMDNA